MKNSVQTVEELQAEIHRLRTRVTELETHEQELQRLNEFLNTVSHEMKNPLTVINGNIQLVKRRLNAFLSVETISDEQLDTFALVYGLLNSVEQQVQTENHLIDDLLDVSRIQSNRLTLNKDIGDLHVILEMTYKKLHLMVPNRTITIEDAVQKPLPVFIDTNRIKQVIQHYVINALKFSEADSAVTIRLDADEHNARVAVHNAGPGIAIEEQERIWQHFYQIADNEPKHEMGKGLGLGLYISQAIIELHQGNVGLESSPDQGSTFWFTLPLAA